MIGNDIIDLNFAHVNSRWQEQRFLDKLFSQDEQAFILNNELRFQNTWRLWSMKESAYKIHSRTFTPSIFNPKSYRCRVSCGTTGIVSFDNFRVNTTTIFNSNIIYTTASFQEPCLTEYFEFEQLSQADNSKELRKKAIQAFGQIKSVPETDISIFKDDFGVPQFYIKEKTQRQLLTLTHHGNYGGFAITF